MANMAKTIAYLAIFGYNWGVRSIPKQLTMSGFFTPTLPISMQSGVSLLCSYISYSSPLGVAGCSEQTPPLTRGLLYFCCPQIGRLYNND